jgi:hypothetical protein|tara:strand:- start:69 stop:332 length:264 start_codon:yes stop_codon:yes gene_type:complete
MKVLFTTVAIMLYTATAFAQVDGPRSHDRDTISYQRIDLTILRNDLCDIYTWQQEDIFNDRHVCEYSHELLRAIIEDLDNKLLEITD